jgi:hypothetical protein
MMARPLPYPSQTPVSRLDSLVISTRHVRAVNFGSRSVAFTIAALLWILPALAHADRVVLYPLGGRADQDRLDDIEERVAGILRDQGHTLVPPTNAQRPSTSAAMQSAASAGTAQYVVLADVEPLRGQYRLSIQVYFAPAGRTEDLVVSVLEAEEAERLSDVLSSMVRREGLGEDALRLTGDGEPTVDPGPTVDPEAERLAEEERRRQEEERRRREEEERREAEERAQREAQEARERAQTAEQAWNTRAQYTSDGHWLVQLAIGGAYAAPLGSIPALAQASGGGVFDVRLRVGRSFDGLDGFELRGGIDFLTGAFNGTSPGGSDLSLGFMGLGVHVGAAWLGSFFVEPVFIGVGGEVGVIFTFTGSRDVGFSGRLGALFAWRPIEHLTIEASIPEIGVLSPGSGVFSIGASVRAGYRFD